MTKQQLKNKFKIQWFKLRSIFSLIFIIKKNCNFIKNLEDLITKNRKIY